MIVFDPMYFLIVGPAILLALIAQIWIRAAYAAGNRVVASMTGAELARLILDSAGLYDVDIEMIPGTLTDHYDPSARVLRLSPGVFQGRTASAVGVAAHEAGHALQHAEAYAPLVIRNLAVPAASFGSGAAIWMFILGLIFSLPMLVWLGIICFSAFVFFQLVNLPVEFNASARARAAILRLGALNPEQIRYVDSVLTAAALTYVAATLQAVLTLLYLIIAAQRRD